MYKKEVKKVIMALSLITICAFLITDSFAINTENVKKTDGWSVKITSDTKDLTSKNTEDIIFKVEPSEYVSKGKIAPGLTAKANIEIDLSGTKYPVLLNLNVAKESLPLANMNLSALYEGDIYELGTNKLIELENEEAFTSENGKKEIELVLKWEDCNTNNDLDNWIGVNTNNISVPICLTVEQNI